jgi:hypothetical protein
MRAHEIFPLMEGILGSVAGTIQPVAQWVKHAKELMLSGANKDKTDWEFDLSEDIDESANNIRTGASTLYGGVIAYNAATAAGDLLCITNDTTNTYDGTAALDATDLLVMNLPAAATEDTEEFHCFMLHEGKAFGTGLTVGADAQGGTNPATNDVRGWFLYRTA